MGYDYKKLREDIDRLCGKYSFAENSIIGYSVMKNPIHCIKVGEGNKKLFVNCAHHGLEYLTSAFIMRFLREYCASTVEKNELFGYNTGELRRRVTLYAVPMVNPDGVDIAVNGIDITNPHHRKLISLVGIHSFNRVWQANARGVDINHNYNAGWRAVKAKPSATRYAGPYSESEPETKAVVDFVRREKFDMLIAFHSQGSEIYYDFDGMQAENSLSAAKKMAEVSGYAVSVPEGAASFGGCKDWFIKEFGRAGFTVEMGKGENPLALSELDGVYEENARLIFESMSELYE